MNLRELNHILIPSYERRAALAQRRWVQVLRRPLTLLLSLSREGQILLLLTFVVAMTGMDVHFTPLYRVFCGLSALLIVGFFARRLARVEGLTLRVEHPRRVTAGGEITFTLVLKNEGRAPAVAMRVFGPFLPWDGAWTSPKPDIPLIPPGEEARVQLTARFLLRGRRQMGTFYAASVYPLGLFYGRMINSAPIQFTVIPPIYPVIGLPDPPSITEPPDQRGRLYSAGESFELLGVRPYRPGDRIRDLHARSSARLGEPMVREYRRAARKRAIVLLQADGASRARLDAAVTLAASLCQWGVRIDALIELLISGGANGGASGLTIGAHAAGIDVALDVLAGVKAREDAPKGQAAPPAADLERLLGPRLRAPGAVFLIFTRWGAPEAALWAQARQRAPVVYALSLDGAPPPEVQRLEPPLNGPLQIKGGRR
ncbi:DUF58 domain-containing protein [Myxococcota bacterium]|nr:DUF58 domain-containing protein [Myxococcota bacterium]MBU1432737.1 DUF58 domain-containing protein [Myxococcota bacterium]MBU1899746.1 DUF58 domain-containing protein [Myxococcota bacterium]